MERYRELEANFEERGKTIRYLKYRLSKHDQAAKDHVECAQKLKEISGRCETLQQDLNAAVREVEQQTSRASELAQIQIHHRNYNDDVSRLRTNLEKSEATIVNLRQQLQSSQEHQATLREEVQTLQNQQVHCDQTIRDLRIERQQTTQTLETQYQLELSQYTNELQGLNGEIQQLRKEDWSVRNAANQQLQNQQAEYEATLITLRKDLEKVRSENKDLADERSSFDQAIKKANQGYERISNTLANASATNIAAIAELERQVSDLTSRNSSLVTQIAILENQAVEMNAELSSLHAQVQSLTEHEENITRANEDLQKTKIAHASCTVQLADLEDRLSTSTERNYILTEEVSALKRAAVELDADFQYPKGHISSPDTTFDVELSNLRSRISTLTTQASTLSCDLTRLTTRIEDLERDNTRLAIIVERKEDEKKELEGDVNTLTTILASTRSLVESAKLKRNAADRKLQTSEISACALRGKIDDLEKALADEKMSHSSTVARLNTTCRLHSNAENLDQWFGYYRHLAFPSAFLEQEYRGIIVESDSSNGSRVNYSSISTISPLMAGTDHTETETISLYNKCAIDTPAADISRLHGEKQELEREVSRCQNRNIVLAGERDDYQRRANATEGACRIIGAQLVKLRDETTRNENKMGAKIQDLEDKLQYWHVGKKKQDRFPIMSSVQVVADIAPQAETIIKDGASAAQDLGAGVSTTICKGSEETNSALHAPASLLEPPSTSKSVENGAKKENSSTGADSKQDTNTMKMALSCQLVIAQKDVDIESWQSLSRSQYVIHMLMLALCFIGLVSQLWPQPGIEYHQRVKLLDSVHTVVIPGIIYPSSSSSASNIGSSTKTSTTSSMESPDEPTSTYIPLWENDEFWAEMESLVYGSQKNAMASATDTTIFIPPSPNPPTPPVVMQRGNMLTLGEVSNWVNKGNVGRITSLGWWGWQVQEAVVEIGGWLLGQLI